MISKEALEEFKAIWKKEFKEDISDEYALERATSLLTLMKAIYKPITRKEYDMIEGMEKRNEGGKQLIG